MDLSGRREREERQETDSVIRVALLEPDSWRRLGIEGVLTASKQIELVECDADVVLLPWRLVAERGLHEIERHGCPVLVYDDANDPERAAQMLRAGAYGYYVDNGTPEQLVTAVELVSEGHVWSRHEAMRRAVEGNDGDELCAEDLELLRSLELGLTNKEIGQRVGLAEGTIKSRMNRLYKRFGVTSRLQLLSAAIRRGVVGAGRDEC